jgi:hypothetical protein
MSVRTQQQNFVAADVRWLKLRPFINRAFQRGDYGTSGMPTNRFNGFSDLFVLSSLVLAHLEGAK